MNKIRDIIFHKQYFADFYDQQRIKVREKIDYVLFILTHAERVPGKFLKHIEGSKGLYEIRVEAGSNIFRIFCCFDKGQIVVLFNGFQKKSAKAPRQEIELANKLMNEYFDLKKSIHEKE